MMKCKYCNIETSNEKDICEGCSIRPFRQPSPKTQMAATLELSEAI